MGSCSDMEQVRQNTLIKWNRALINMGPVPDNSRVKIAKGLVGCFTHRDNPHRSHSRHLQFQRELEEMVQEENFYGDPTVSRLCDLVARPIHQWEQTQ